MGSIFPSDEELKENIERKIKPLSNTLRQKLLLLLADGPITYTEILDVLQIESGSFYWHLKKMGDLITQDGGKRYCLTKAGYNAVEIVKPEKSLPIIHTEHVPDWYESVRTIINTWNDSLVLLLIQLIFQMVFTISLYHLEGYVQYGTQISPGERWLSAISLISSSVLILIIQLVVLTSASKKGFWRKYNTTIIVSSILKSFIIINLLYFPGIVAAFYNLILGNQIPAWLLFMISLISLGLCLILSIAIIDDSFEYGFKNSSIAVLIVYYPVVLISYLFV